MSRRLLGLGPPIAEAETDPDHIIGVWRAGRQDRAPSADVDSAVDGSSDGEWESSGIREGRTRVWIRDCHHGADRRRLAGSRPVRTPAWPPT
jgi:hypothetical protein